MNTLLFIPALLLGFPFVLGGWIAASRVYTFLTSKFSGQTAFVVTLCLTAAALSLMTAPVWLIGWKGYALVCAVYVLFVGVGAPHIRRILKFLAIELDSNPDNDVPLPGDNDATAPKVPTTPADKTDTPKKD